MGSRIFQLVVAVLWLSTMGWLLVSKVLPPLVVGEPPTFQSTLPDNDQPVDQLVCWHLICNDKPRGWAATRRVASDEGVTEIHSRVMLDELPLKDMVPVLMRPAVEKYVGRVSMDARSRIEIDPLGRLCGLTSKVDLPQLENAIIMTGEVEDGQLNVKVKVGDELFQKQQRLPPNALFANELAPQAELRGLRKGQSWTLPIYSPFRKPDDPVEMLNATVDREAFLEWDGESMRVWVVLYRNDSGAGLTASSKPRGTMWVAHDGRVLQQEVAIVNTRLRFVRMASGEAESYAQELSPEWLAKLETKTSGRGASIAP